MSGGQIAYMVTYNGTTSIHTATIPAVGAPKSDKLTIASETVQAVTANAGIVRVESFSETGAHFVSAYAEQEGTIFGAVNGMVMNGKELVVTVNVDLGEKYYVDDVATEENVKDVTLYFMDQATGEIHGQFSSNTTPSKNSPAKWGYEENTDEGTGVFTLRIPQFDPAHPTEWTYGDVLMARLTTDKQSAISEWTQEQSQKYSWDEEKGEWVAVPVGESDKVDMYYEPVSTGIAVAADPDYKPQTFDFDLDNLAQSLGIAPKTDEEGNLLDDNTRYSFGAFPYIGEISAAVHVFSRVLNSATASAEMDAIMEDLSGMANTADDIEDGFDFGDDGVDAGDQASGSSSGGSVKNATLNVLLKVDETKYGGVRFMFGVVISYGDGKGYQRQRNPFQNVNSLIASMQANIAFDKAQNATDLIMTKSGGDFYSKKEVSDFGGAYFKFSAFLGLYLDYGYVEISTANGKEKSHEMVFMGAGGFIGFNGNVGYTWAFAIGPVPAYVNVEAGLGVTFFLGSEGNPQSTLQSFKTEPELHGQDFQFNFEFQGRIYVSGTIGVGLYKILGVRVTLTVGFEAGYGNNITEWYPNLFKSGWGYTADVTFAGSIDLVLTSIDLYSATWPLPIADGYLYYFQEVRRANKCISYIENGIQKGNGSQAARDHAQVGVDALKKMVDTNELLAAGTADTKPELASTEAIEKLTYSLASYAFKNGIISWVAKNTIEMNKQGGIVGSAINGSLQDDTAPGLRFHTNDHVSSQWVANDGQLMAAYGNASSKAIMQDAYAQPSSKIMDIGGGKYLVVFLDDTESRDKMQAATLKWTIYDTNGDTWTTPAVVQSDNTVDGRPNLADAGEKVILSWSSISDAKYDALKAEVVQELTAKGLSATDVDVQAALEADPARVMAQMDIFSAEFNKSSETFGAIEQLTDDKFYDDYPQAVYDSETGDYIVMYYKTAQDDEDYEDAGDKLRDLIGASPDPQKTYSVICYMLYNNQTDVADTNGVKHEAGWATNYFFPNETNADLDGQASHLARWRGQRFLPSTLRDEDGGQIDPPITDLTVAVGYNGLAAYAFTVDKDFNLKTAEDRELYVEFYNFKTHGTYVPIRVAGSVTETSEHYIASADQFVTVESERQVEVGAPKLIRNNGSTYLFWRENGQSLKYLNISELLTAKVAAVANPSNDNESDWTYALKADGTFATDAITGEKYQPNVQKVDFGALCTNEDIEITDYDVITAQNGKQNDLYVVWTDTVTSTATDEGGMTYPVTAQEIYASAMIHQAEKTTTETDENGASVTAQTVRWSKPYRLTRENNFNDGLALALDPDGNLIIVHNQYSKLMPQSEEEMMALIADGKIGVTKDSDGQLYAASLSYNSPVSLMLTRFEKVGSLEATAFDYSDYKPVAGETIAVTAAIENVGLMDAEGYEIKFYENKNGQRGSQIGETITGDSTIPVNTAQKVSFSWTVPADGPDGYSIEAVIREKNDAGYYAAVSSYSDAFKSEPFYRVKATEAIQEGDQFRVKFTASNAGNLAAEEGTTLSLRLVGLYGELSSDRYGNLETNVLYSRDVTSELQGKTLQEKTAMDAYAVPQSAVYSDEVLVDIPVSVFRYCGYDAIQAVITDKAGNVLADSDQLYVTMDQPVNLSLNDGKAVSLSTGDSKQVSLGSDTTVFMEKGTVVYEVQDPSIATVSSDGTLMGVTTGETTLRATMLPSGKSVTVPVQVSSGGSVTPDTPSTPGTPSTPAAETMTVKVSGDEGAVSVSATVNDNTAAVTAPTQAQMEEITGKGKETGSVTIDLSSLPEDITAVSIPAETVKAIDKAMEDNAEGLIIKLPNSTVTFDPEALSAIADQTTGSDLQLNVDPISVNMLNARQRDAVSDLDVQAVYDIYLTSDDKRITDFGDGKAAVELTHRMKDGQQAKDFTVWYVADAGSREKVPTTATANAVKFTVTHFSNYVVAYDEAFATACGRGSDCPMAAYSDLNTNAWYHDGVHWALENDIMKGVSRKQNVFAPGTATNRAMIVTMLYRMEGEPRSLYALSFEDVPAGKWYTEAVRWAAGNGIVTGYSSKKFGPDDVLTREQLVTILERYARYKGVDTSAGEYAYLNAYRDSPSVAKWAIKAMRWAADADIVNGGTDGKLSPKANATRAQVATMLMRFDALSNQK